MSTTNLKMWTECLRITVVHWQLVIWLVHPSYLLCNNKKKLTWQNPTCSTELRWSNLLTGWTTQCLWFQQLPSIDGEDSRKRRPSVGWPVDGLLSFYTPWFLMIHILKPPFFLLKSCNRSTTTHQPYIFSFANKHHQEIAQLSHQWSTI